MIGELFADRFYIDGKLASGGFGTVYRATHVSTKTPVAIKVLHDRYATSRSVTRRFEREAAALRSVRHPHVVATHEQGVDGQGRPFLVMELLSGESLAERFAKRGALPWRNVIAILRETCSALAEAHARGIVHRDLKPANIFLATAPMPDFVKLLDFGVAKGAQGSAIDDGTELTQFGEAVGTLEYMSPEQLAGGAVDGRSDLYTLAVVAFEMITGRRPFADAGSATGLITAILTRRPPPPSTVTRAPLPRDLDGVLLRCLERDPKDRYADVRELAAALDRMLATRATGATQQLWMAHTAVLPQGVPAPLAEHVALGSRPVVVRPPPAVVAPVAPVALGVAAKPPSRVLLAVLGVAALATGMVIALAVLA